MDLNQSYAYPALKFLNSNNVSSIQQLVTFCFMAELCQDVWLPVSIA